MSGSRGKVASLVGLKEKSRLIWNAISPTTACHEAKAHDILSATVFLWLILFFKTILEAYFFIFSSNEE